MNDQSPKKLAVITINHLHQKMIKKAVESLVALNDEIPFQAYIINNLPDKTSENWLTETFPEIRVIENAEPRGFAANINAIIQKNPDYDYFLLLNPDVICLPGLLEKLLEVMETQPQIGAAGPELLNMDGTVQPSRRRFATFPVLIMRALHIDSLFKNIPAVDRYLMKDTAFEGNTDVDWITGAVMLLRKKTLDAVGLFDERFYMYFEDEDLCCRMWREGWRVCYVTEAQAYHAHIAEGRKKLFSEANFHHIASAFKMMLKYGGKIAGCYEK
jgi:GT2 family glycosyltransferase